MPCVHLQKLFQLCEDNQLRFSSADLVHVVCDQCQRDEVCPTMLMDQFEGGDSDEGEQEPTDSAPGGPAASTKE